MAISTTSTLIPNYIDMDYSTIKTSISELMASNPVFKDFDIEGANITTLIELMSYIGALNTYYLNMLAKNQFIPTSTMYEPTHMLSQLGGYNPRGYLSSQANITITLNSAAVSAATIGYGEGETLLIEEWSKLSCSSGITNLTTGNPIEFITMTPTTSYSLDDIVNAPTGEYEIELVAREGRIARYTYNGADIIDDKIYLPIETFDYDDDLTDDIEPIQLYVGDEKWTRLEDWFSSSETITNGYMLKYDKYKRYYIEFSNTRNVPTYINDIVIYLLVSSGVDGNLAAGLIDTPPTSFIIRFDTGVELPTNCYTITNESASIGGSNPETIKEIKNSTLGTLHSQYRNVTKNDYISNLESRADIIQANVWGEQEQNPSGSVQDYNKVYISVVPTEWSSACEIVPSGSTTTTPISAISYLESYKEDVSEYIRPRKILTVYEQYVPPELLYFRFVIGLKIKPNYTYTNVKNDVKAKLEYYFNSYNRTFNEQISFIDITEYILNMDITSPTDTFSNIKGLRSLVMRNVDIVVYSPVDPYYTEKHIYEYNEDNNYPYYVESSFTIDNTLRTIQLGHNQFPMVYIASDTFRLEV